MAGDSGARSGRAATTPQNSATMGVILVVAAVVVAILLFNAGGGNAADSDGDRTAAEAARGSSGGTTTTTAVPDTTPPANLVVAVGNGSGVGGRAKATADALAMLGYTNNKAVDGESTATTIVYFLPGLDADAAALAAKMGLSPDRAVPMPDPIPLKESVEGAQLVVLVGGDFDPATANFNADATGTN